MNKPRLLIIGAGGHAKVVFDTAVSNYDVTFADKNLERHQESFLSAIVLSPIEKALADNQNSYVHIAIGDNQVRLKWLMQLEAYPHQLATIQSDLAAVSPYASIADGAFIAPFAIIANSASVGLATIINHHAVVDHDCQIGAACHIAPSATLGGSVVIDDGVFVGSNATVLPGIRIGKNSIIGAGSVVIKDVSENTVVKGVPARHG